MSFVHTILLYPRGPWVDGVYWTIGIEMVFYGLIWLLLISGRFAYIQGALIVMGLPSAIIWYLTALGPLQGFSINRVFELLLLRHGCYFALGGLMFLNYRDGLSVGRALGGLFFAGACLIEIAHVHPETTLAAEIVWFAAVLCIGLGAWANDSLTSLLHRPWVRNIGLATYPLYLIHDVPGAAILRWTSALPDFLALIIALATVICLSFALLLPERLLRGWLRRPVTFLASLIASPVFRLRGAIT